MADEKYCYDGTNVLINKFDIHDKAKLLDVERQLTMLRLSELIIHPVAGDFNLAHLQKIHKYIFQDIYPWAGKIRTVDIGKGNMFCNVRFIYEQADEIFGKLQADNYLDGLGKNVYIKKLAYYFSEINALHPFREGNGRAQREFIRNLALRNGYVIHFENIEPQEMLEASKTSFMCDYTLMENLFAKCITNM